MDPITLGLLIGGGGGFLKSLFIDSPKEQRQIDLASATQRYSPWTGLKAQPIQHADPFGSTLQFGATGASMGAGIKSQGIQDELTQAMTNRMNTGGSPLGYGPDLTDPSSYDHSPLLGGAQRKRNPWSLLNN